MKTLYIAPSYKQDLFMRCKARHVMFGGARGGGKSWVIDQKAKLMALAYPGIKQLIVRKTMAELRGNHIDLLRSDLLGIATYNAQDKRLYFSNGSIIEFTYYACERDETHIQGREWDIIYIDEATNLDETWIKKIIACNRGANDFPKRMYYTCNPGGISHAYFKRLFVDRNFQDGERPDDYAFIQSRVTDNYALMAMQPEYIEQLKTLPPKLRAAWLEGSWDIFDGAFFEEFRNDPEHYGDRKWTHVIEPFTPSKHWAYYRSFDWGYNKPFSCGWWAVDYDGRYYRILELYGCQRNHGQAIPDTGVKMYPHEVFAKIHEIETQHPWLAGRHIHGVADPAIWDAEHGESIAESAEKAQVFFEEGDNRRIAGWMQMHYRFAFSEDGIPMMYIFSNCQQFIRTIPTLQYDEKAVEDLDTHSEDHIADETRYFCMMNPLNPIKNVEPYVPKYGVDPLKNVHRHRRRGKVYAL